MRAIGFVVAIAIAVLLLLGVERLADAATAQVLLLVLTLATLMAIGVMLRPEPAMPLLCDPFLLSSAFLAQFYIIGPIIMAVWGLSPIVFFRAPSIEDAMPPLLGCILMTACMIIGYRSGLGTIVANLLPDARRVRGKFPRTWLIVVLAFVSLVGSLWWIQYQGGFLAKLGMGYGIGKAGAAFTLVWNVYLLATILWAWHLLDLPHRTKRQMALFYSFLALEALFFGVILGVRKYLFFLFFGLLCCWALRRGVRTLPKMRTAIALVAILAFFTVWGSVRATPVATMLGFGETTSRVRARDYREGYFTGVADPFGSAALVWQVFPSQEPFRHGRTLLVTVFLFIPRAVWPEKPVGIGKELTRYYVGPFYEPTEGYSVTPTLPADLYVNFGWPGIAIGGLLLGMAFRGAVSYSVRGMKGGLQLNGARVLFPALFVMGLGEVRADMAQILAFYIMTGIPLVLFLFLFRIDREKLTVTMPRSVSTAA